MAELLATRQASAVSNIELAQKVDMFTQWISCRPLSANNAALIPYFWESDFFSKRLIDEVHWLLALGWDYTQVIVPPCAMLANTALHWLN